MTFSPTHSIIAVEVKPVFGLSLYGLDQTEQPVCSVYDSQGEKYSLVSSISRTGAQMHPSGRDNSEFLLFKAEKEHAPSPPLEGIVSYENAGTGGYYTFTNTAVAQWQFRDVFSFVEKGVSIVLRSNDEPANLRYNVIRPGALWPPPEYPLEWYESTGETQRRYLLLLTYDYNSGHEISLSDPLPYGKSYANPLYFDFNESDILDQVPIGELYALEFVFDRPEQTMYSYPSNGRMRSLELYKSETPGIYYAPTASSGDYFPYPHSKPPTFSPLGALDMIHTDIPVWTEEEYSEEDILTPGGSFPGTKDYRSIVHIQVFDSTSLHDWTSKKSLKEPLWKNI